MQGRYSGYAFEKTILGPMQKGEDARKQGKTIDVNPYDPVTRRGAYIYWIEGWNGGLERFRQADKDGARQGEGKNNA